MSFEKLLAEFKEPRNGKERLPYVLFAKKGYNARYEKMEDGTNALTGWDKTEELFMLPCNGSNAHKEKVEQYTSKGWKVLKWWLPVGIKQDPFKGCTDFGDDVDHFEELDRACRQSVDGAGALDAEKAELISEKSILENQLKEARERLAEVSKQRGANR